MRPLTNSLIPLAKRSYDRTIEDHEQDLQILSEQGFEDLFLRPARPEVRVFAYMTDEEDGFIIGHYDGLTGRFFVTMVVVDRASRRQGKGTRLVEHLYSEMCRFAAENGLSRPDLEISYFNPVNIRWIIPGTDHHTHQNSQGVKLGSGAHLFFKNLGFRDFAYQNTYHLDLREFVLREDVLSPYEDRLARAGLSVEFFDPVRHSDMTDLLKDLNNDIWSLQIPEEMGREGGPRPMLIVNDHCRSSGFAGPIVVEPDGRCWFLGVAVHSRCRGNGAATVLFTRMVEAFQKAGARYLTLFTGENNPARNIYERAGMKIVYAWANMRRTAK